MNNLSCKCVPRLDGVSAAELERLFPGPSITASLLSLLEESGVDGFNLRSIVVFKDNTPVLLLPLFETRFDLSAFVKGWRKKALKAAGSLIPSVFQPRILGVGLVEGEWSEIGIDPDIDEGTLDTACKMAFSALQTLAAELKSDIVTLYNFNQYGNIPGEVFKKFNQVNYRSCARLPINFSSIEEYLSSLSRVARKGLRRKMRVAPEVRVMRSLDISPFLDRIYTLYLKTVERSPMALGVHNRLFFEKICEAVPGAAYMLYFLEEELVAFNLLVVRQEAMVDMYFCMDQDSGRKYNLYFLSWLENVRTCIEQKIPLYYAGQGTEKTKAHLGATFIPSFIYFKHRWQLFDRLLAWPPAMTGKILSHLGFWPRMTVAPNGTMEIYDQRT
ncbi:MAG: GNAT family N-acetyltransferase [Desulfuromonadaceae bacterium]|nr:GNAT family N-acetyltransferase [Desulfuromonadaceae bacterium]